MKPMKPTLFCCPVPTCKSTSHVEGKCYQCERDSVDAYVRKPLYDEATVLEAATEVVMQVYKHLGVPVFRERAEAEAAMFIKAEADQFLKDKLDER